MPNYDPCDKPGKGQVDQFNEDECNRHGNGFLYRTASKAIAGKPSAAKLLVSESGEKVERKHDRHRDRKKGRDEQPYLAV